MDKLEIKLTLTADSTPELLRYLRGISSARDRAFILKRLATTGLSALSDGISVDAILLPSPSSEMPSPAINSGMVTAERSIPVSGRADVPAQAETLAAGNPAAMKPEVTHVAAIERETPPSPPPAQQAAVQTVEPAASPGFAFLDLDALNAATAQFG